MTRLSAGERPSGWNWPATTERDVEGTPLQSALASEVASGPFVGRQDALERMRVRFERARAGARQFVLLAGEPGIGKTRLAAEIANEAHAAGATVLYGRSDAESLVPYQPFVTAVQHYMAHRISLELPPELEPELSELARLVPALRRHLPELREPLAEDGQTRRYRLFEAVTRILARIARESPTVLVLDDLQWADASTALLLGHMLQDVEAMQLLVVATIRESGGHRAEEVTELLSRLYRDPGFERIALEGLDDAETQALVRTQDQRDPSGSFILRLHEGTEGNPFFIKETLRSLADMAPEEDQLRDETLSRVPVPEGVKELIGTRLARLGEKAAAVLTPAAVVGREFRLELLEALLDEPVERIISALEEADEQGIVREVADDADRFVFAHALVRETLYERQSASRRVRLHHRIAEALESLGPRIGATPAELAYHFVESRHLDREGKAVGYCEQAAEAAIAALAYEEAKGYYQDALERLANNAPRRCRLLIGLGTAAARMADPTSVGAFDEAAAIARREGLNEELALAAMGRFGTYSYAHAGTIDQDAIALLEVAIEAQTDEGPLLSQLLARLANALHFTGQFDRIEELSVRALELARASGDPLALVTALESRHGALIQSPHVHERLALATELYELALRNDERELRLLGLHWRAFDMLELGDVDGARREARQLTALAQELSQPFYRHFAARWDVLWAIIADRLDEAPALILRAHELATRARAPEADVEAAGQQFALAYRTGILGQFAALLDAQIKENPQLVVNLPALALAQMQAGNPEAAAEIFNRIAADDFSVVPRDMLWLGGMAILSQVCAMLGDAEHAQVLYRLLLPHRDRTILFGMAACWGSMERMLGLLAGAMGELDRRSSTSTPRSRATPRAGWTRCSRWSGASSRSCWRSAARRATPSARRRCAPRPSPPPTPRWPRRRSTPAGSDLRRLRKVRVWFPNPVQGWTPRWWYARRVAGESRLDA